MQRLWNSRRSLSLHRIPPGNGQQTGAKGAGLLRESSRMKELVKQSSTVKHAYRIPLRGQFQQYSKSSSSMHPFSHVTPGTGPHLKPPRSPLTGSQGSKNHLPQKRVFFTRNFWKWTSYRRSSAKKTYSNGTWCIGILLCFAFLCRYILICLARKHFSLFKFAKFSKVSPGLHHEFWTEFYQWQCRVLQRMPSEKGWSDATCFHHDHDELTQVTIAL